MKICFFGDVRSVHVQKFIRWFAKDHETHLVSIDYYLDPRTDTGKRFFYSIGTKLHLIRPQLLPFSPVLAAKVVKEISPDIVQCHFVTNYGFLGAQATWRGFLGDYFNYTIPLVVSAMGDDILIHPKQSIIYNLMVRYALSRADAVICDGQNSLVELQNIGVPKEKIMLVYPGVNMEIFHPNKRVPLPYRTVFYPRGFDKIYDVDTVFDTIEMVHWVLPEARFALMGTGTELERFEDKARIRGLTKIIDYLGNIDNSKVPMYLASSDVSFTCSLSDGGIPTSTIEAMACGVPVVSTDAGDASLWVQNGKTGYTVEKRDGAAMASHIIALLEDDEKRKELGRNARDLVCEKWNYASEMKKIESLYSKLINTRKS